MTSTPLPSLAELVPTATVHDVSEQCAYLGPGVVRRVGGRTIGRALTVRTGAGDNLALHRAVATADPGDVLVVTCPGPPVGLAGEVICTALLALGARGLVTDSGVRAGDQLAAGRRPGGGQGRQGAGLVGEDPPGHLAGHRHAAARARLTTTVILIRHRKREQG